LLQLVITLMVLVSQVAVESGMQAVWRVLHVVMSADPAAVHVSRASGVHALALERHVAMSSWESHEHDVLVAPATAEALHALDIVMISCTRLPKVVLVQADSSK